MNLTRLDIDNLDDLTVAFAELKLEATDAPLVWLAEQLIASLKSGGSPTGKAQVAAQLVNVLKELGATPSARGGSRPTNDVINSFKKKD